MVAKSPLAWPAFPANQPASRNFSGASPVPENQSRDYEVFTRQLDGHVKNQATGVVESTRQEEIVFDRTLRALSEEARLESERADAMGELMQELQEFAQLRKEEVERLHEEMDAMIWELDQKTSSMREGYQQMGRQADTDAIQAFSRANVEEKIFRNYGQAHEELRRITQEAYESAEERDQEVKRLEELNRVLQDKLLRVNFESQARAEEAQQIIQDVREEAGRRCEEARREVEEAKQRCEETKLQSDKARAEALLESEEARRESENVANNAIRQQQREHEQNLRDLMDVHETFIEEQNRLHQRALEDLRDAFEKASQEQSLVHEQTVHELLTSFDHSNHQSSHGASRSFNGGGD